MINRDVIRKRQKARKILVQALYQWQLNHAPFHEIQAQFMLENNEEKYDVQYFALLLSGIIDKIEELDAKIIPCLDRKMEMLNPVEQAILRLSTYEFLYCLDIPFKVIIDEAISLTKTYGAIEGHRYVNGVLHQLATSIRELEVNHAKK